MLDPYLCFITVFILKSVLSDMNIDTPAFFWFPFSWNAFFHSLTFSLYVSLELKWVSCKQHTYKSCFCIHSDSLCHLDFRYYQCVCSHCHFNCFVYVFVGLFSFHLILFSCALMNIFRVAVGLPFLICMCVYCRFLVCINHEVLQ